MLVLITICCVPNLAFASESLESEKEIVEINEQTLQLTQNDRKNFEEFADKLALELQSSEEEDYDKIIQRAYQSGSNIIGTKAKSVIKKQLTNPSDDILLNTSKSFLEDNAKVYTTDEHNTFLITPLYVVHDKLDVSKEVEMSRTTTKSKFATNSKTAYGFLGNKLFDVTVECRFNYNGNRAWYKSDFDYYYTKGFLSIWQVSNWKGSREASGSSYKAKCSGNFHYGLEYEGNGLVIQDIYCRNTITCSKDGRIYKSTSW
ncbi:hypothetical protein ACQRB4_04585 [Peptoniphilaceae bacterium SGI.097]